MNSRGITSLALLFVVALGGCGGSGNESAAASSTSRTSTTATPSPTPTYSTDEQIASVIAGGEKLWREVEEEKFACRLALVEQEDDFSASAHRMTCYTNELTAGIKAQNALRDLAELSVPPSMGVLVADTQAALQAMIDTDLEAACGPAMTEPKDTEACSSALGARAMSYTVLSSTLDKWAPYL